MDFLLGLIQYLMEYLIWCDIEAPNEVATESYLRLAPKAYSRNSPGAKLTAETRNGQPGLGFWLSGRTQKRGKVMFWAQQLSFSLIC